MQRNKIQALARKIFIRPRNWTAVFMKIFAFAMRWHSGNATSLFYYVRKSAPVDFSAKDVYSNGHNDGPHKTILAIGTNRVRNTSSRKRDTSMRNKATLQHHVSTPRICWYRFVLSTTTRMRKSVNISGAQVRLTTTRSTQLCSH